MTGPTTVRHAPGRRAADTRHAVQRGYDPSRYPAFAVTADVVLLTLAGGQLSVLLVERATDPYVGQWALPGGFVQPDESPAQAAGRKLADETGMSADGWHLEQLRTYGEPDRDPRMRVVTVAHVALAPNLPDPQAGGSTRAARFVPVADLGLGLFDDEPEVAPALAFDHADIVADGVERARAKLEYTTLATSFLQAPFTLGDLRRIYETVWGTDLHRGNFHRKVLSVDGFVRATGGQRGRAALYGPGGADAIVPPMIR